MSYAEAINHWNEMLTIVQQYLLNNGEASAIIHSFTIDLLSAMHIIKTIYNKALREQVIRHDQSWDKLPDQVQSFFLSEIARMWLEGRAAAVPDLRSVIAWKFGMLRKLKQHARWRRAKVESTHSASARVPAASGDSRQPTYGGSLETPLPSEVRTPLPSGLRSRTQPKMVTLTEHLRQAVKNVDFKGTSFKSLSMLAINVMTKSEWASINPEMGAGDVDKNECQVLYMTTSSAAAK